MRQIIFPSLIGLAERLFFSVFAWHMVETEATVCDCNKYLLAHLEACMGHNSEGSQLRNREETLQNNFFFSFLKRQLSGPHL